MDQVLALALINYAPFIKILLIALIMLVMAKAIKTLLS
jgi:hypothetical protein